ncbi:MAG: LarC family nickel insertion protein [Clostridia bacterium]
MHNHSPTGAALLKHFVTRFDQMPLMTPASTGYGMGTKDFPAANCVRAILGESFAENQPEQPACIPAAPASTATPAPEEAAITETICELSCNVDDMTGEDIAFAIETFLQNGALDAFTVPCTMKKGRPGVLVTVLCKDPDQKQMTKLILQHTTTLGVRSAIKKRWVLSRTESETVIPDDMLANVTVPNMPAGSKTQELKTTGNDCTIRSKTSTGFGITRNKYEHDDLEKIARTYGLTLAQVRALLADLHQPQ